MLYLELVANGNRVFILGAQFQPKSKARAMHGTFPFGGRFDPRLAKTIKLISAGGGFVERRALPCLGWAIGFYIRGLGILLIEVVRSYRGELDPILPMPYRMTWIRLW